MRLAAWLALTVGCAAYAQDDGTLKLKVETRAVQMNVAVKDKEGRPVRDLRKQDFTVLDNGKPREIALFAGEEDTAPATRTPVALPPNTFSNRFGAAASPGRLTAILIDALNSSFEVQSFARQQALKSVERMAPGDSIALYALKPELGILQDYTTDRELLLKAVRAYMPQPPRSGRGSGRGIAQMLMRSRVEGALEALKLIATKMGGASGRKSIVWVTAGFPPNGDYNLVIDSTLNAINNANVAIYPVDARGLLVSSSGMINVATMQRFAQQTGGHAFYNRNDIDQALVEAVADARYNYALGFYLSESDLDGRFHELKVKVDRPGLVLHHRRGYSADKEPEKPKRVKEELSTAMLNPIDSNDIGIDAKVEKVDSASSVRIQIAITPGEPGDYSMAGMLVETDARGYMLAKNEGLLKFTIRPGRNSAGMEKTLPLRAGAVKLRIVLRETSTGRTGSLTIPVDALSPGR